MINAGEEAPDFLLPAHFGEPVKLSSFKGKKNKSQPSKIKTGGSTFKNPIDQTQKNQIRPPINFEKSGYPYPL